MQILHRLVERRNGKELARSDYPGHSLFMLSDESASPEQIAALRAMPGERRLRMAEQLYWSAREMKAAGLRHQHSEWGEERVKAEVTRIFLHARI